MNQLIYNFAVWLDSHQWSTALHESYYMYNWVETTHVLTLMLSLGMLFFIHLRMLGLVMPNVPASEIARRMNMPMLIGFSIMVITGLLLFYAIPVRSAQNIWFRFKMVLLIGAAINAFVFHRRMQREDQGSNLELRAPVSLRVGAILSLTSWTFIVIFGRLIAYDWFDCSRNPPAFIGTLAGCLADQTHF